MTTTSITPPERFRIVVAGGVEAARAAVCRWTGSRPMFDVSVNGYGAVHATVWATQSELELWWNSCHDNSKPGTLCFYGEGSL